MPSLSWGSLVLVLASAVVSACAGLVGPVGVGRSAEPRAAEEKPLYRGSRSCQSCHVRAMSPFANARANNVADFVRYDEYTTWIERDKHSIAFARLSGPRAREMGTILGIDVADRKAGCLGCHSASAGEMLDREKGDLFDRNEGVSCENCHGPSSKWVGPHFDSSFRSKSTEDRGKLGLIDLRLPAIQANQCLSCHIGEVSEGKVVTHAMYAAGHPPLPSIEVATFAESIPRHWNLVGEKKPVLRAESGYVEGTREKTRLAIVGAAVALRSTMRLVAAEAGPSVERPAPGQVWPDFARFDCWSCHHDLKRDGWRQARDLPGTPGRVPLGEWPTAMVEIGLDDLASHDPAAKVLRSEWLGKRKAILAQVEARPFGVRGPMARAADDLAHWSDQLIDRLASARYDEAAALRLLVLLAARAEELTVDYDSARHVAWTLKILVEDAGSKLANREEIGAILSRLDDGLRLTLPAGRDREIEDGLAEFFLKVGDYEPSAFRRELRAMAALLPKP